MKTKILITIITLTFFYNGFSQFWTEKSSGFTNQSTGVNQFNIIDSNTVWGVGYDGTSTAANYQIFTKSTDGGETWTVGQINIGNAALSVSNICAIDQNTAWVTAFANTAFDRGGVWKTIDGGATWSKQITALYNDSASFANVVYFWDANNGFCQGDPIGGFYELYTTTDGGANWTRVPSPNIPAPLAGEFGYVRQIEIVGDRMWWTTNKGRIFRSDDHGLTHTVYQSPISDFGGAADDTGNGNISFFDENNGLLVTSSNTVFKTTNGGETWVGVTTNGTFKTGDVACIPNSNSVVTVSGENGATGGSSYSLDGGTTWTEVDNTIQHIGVEFKHGLGFTGGFTTDATTGGLSKYTGTELTLSNEENTLTSFKAYPNPFNNVLKVDAIDTISKVEIFNLLGQVVLTETPNVTNAEINTAKLTSGSYIAKVTVNGNTETIKLIK